MKLRSGNFLDCSNKIMMLVSNLLLFQATYMFLSCLCINDKCAKQSFMQNFSLNQQISKNEANCGVMRLIVGGGRAAETADAKGAVIVGVRTLSEGGRVGNFTREQVR